MKRIIILLMTFVVLLTGCGNKKEKSPLSDDIYDFEVMIAGDIFKFPTTVEAFEEKGWELVIGGYEDEEELDPGERTYDVNFKKGNMEFYVVIRNLDNSVLAIEDCVVVGFDVYYEDFEKTSLVELSKGITLGSTLADVIVAYGEPDYTSDDYIVSSSSYYYLNYVDEHGEYYFFFESNNPSEKIVSINVTNNRDADKLVALSEDKEYEVPLIVLNYEKPVEFTEDIYDFIVSLEGEMYQLPVPVSLLLEDGWVIVDNNLKIKEVGAYAYEFDFLIRKGNQVMGTMIANYDKNAQIPENCFIVEMQAIDNFDLELANGIRVGSSVEELVAAFGEPTDISEYISTANYSYKITYSIVYDFNINLTTNKVASINIKNHIRSYN